MMTTRLAVLGALCVAALSHVADVTAYRPGDKYCVVSKDNACPVDKLELSTTDQSALVYPGGKTRCAFDAYNDGNYSTNATFFFQVFPVKEKKEKTKLLLYLQGGGACVGNNTCDFALQCSKQTFQPNARALSEGVLNRTHPENIFNDWNIVHVPYCTGDIHIGNRTHGGPDIGFEAFLGHPKCLNQNQSVHHNGYENSMSAFNWALANFPEVDQLAIAGSSAGSLGAQLFGKLVADMWKVEEKKIRYSVIADSYVGVVPLDKPASTIVNYFDACTLPFDLPQKLVQMCLANTGTIVELISPLLDETSYADWFFINSMGDEIQRMFYELVRVDVFGFIQLTENTTISEANFYANMTSILDQYKDDTKRLTTFFVEGDHHVFLNLDDYYNTPRMNSKEKLGVVLQNVLNNIYPASSGSGSKSAGTPVPGSTSGAASTVTSLLAVAVAAVAVLL